MQTQRSEHLAWDWRQRRSLLEQAVLTVSLQMLISDHAVVVSLIMAFQGPEQPRF